MKNLLLITLILLPFYGMSQTKKPIDSFLGIKFGSSPEQVKAAMQSRGSVFDEANSTDNLLAFEKVSLGNHKTYMFGVNFLNEQAFSAIFIFKADLEAKTLDFYNDLKKDITDVYGVGTTTNSFKHPYKEGDGDELTAIENGYAEYSTLWFDDNRNAIGQTLKADMLITLIYQDAVLGSAAAKKIEAQEKADF